MRRTYWAAAILAVTLGAGCTPPATAASGGPTLLPSSGSPNGATMTTTTAGDAGPSTQGSPADARLSAFAAKFLAEYLERNPTRATEMGEHRHDARFPDLRPEARAEELKFVEGRLAELAGFP